jgi:hypothetical protein
MQHQQLRDPRRVPSWAFKPMIELTTMSDLAVYSTVNNGMILEFVRWSTNNRSCPYREADVATAVE